MTTPPPPLPTPQPLPSLPTLPRLSPNEAAAQRGATGRTRRVLRICDLVLTILLGLALCAVALATSFFGLFVAMVSDACSARVECTALIGIGTLIAVGMPWLICVAAVGAAITLLVRRRPACWVPVIAAPIVIGCYFLGGVIASAGVIRPL